jgi:peptide chain release factor 3
VIPKDIGKRKSFDKGVVQLTEEGAIQLLRPYDLSGDLIFAAVGQLQFEVMQYRLRDEYGVETLVNNLPYGCSAWLIGDIKTFQKPSTAVIVRDRLERPMVLFGEQWEKQYAIKQNPDHQLVDLLA